MINGYTATIPRAYWNNVYLPLETMNVGEMNAEQHQALKDLGVKYVIIHDDAFPEKVSPFPPVFTAENLRAAPFLEFIMRRQPLWLFKVRDLPLEKTPDHKKTSKTGVFYEGEWMPRKTGRAVEDSTASGGMAVFADPEKDSSGFMAFGPYRYLPSGRYRTDFRVKTGPGTESDTSMSAAEIQITKDNGKTILYQKQLYPVQGDVDAVYNTVSFEYVLEKPETLEFRVKTKGTVPVWFDYSYTRFQDQEDPLLSYEIEEMWHAGRTREDPAASGAAALYFVASRDPHDIVVSGPFRVFSAGKYRVSFYVRGAANGTGKDEPVLELLAASGYRTRVYARKEVSASMLDTREYRAVSLDFTLQHRAGLEFLVRFPGGRDVWVDRVEVDRID